MGRIVISLGGSVITRNLEKIRDIADAIIRISKENQVYVVCGGGDVARRYIEVARDFGADEVACDYLGIDFTRINAKLLICALSENAYPDVPLSYREALIAGISGKIVVMGGVSPGYTTDAVSAMLAEYVGADLMINATTVDGIYSSDPKIDRNAIKYKRITPEELVNIVMGSDMRAGSRSVIDPLAAKIIERCGIRTIVVSGENPENILLAFQGKHDGTEVVR
ncbi:MAG: UMP kinase [Candidatus Syntropharchaeia archaeon]